MSDSSFAFGSPSERWSTVYLEHVAGFEVADTSGGNTFVTPDAMEEDADAHPITLRGVLKDEHFEVASLSGEYLLRNLVVPNLPLGFYGDKDSEPVILGATVEVLERAESEDPLEYVKGRMNTVKVSIAPTLGSLARVSCIRDPSLGGYGIDWFVAEKAGCEVSLFGGLMGVTVKYDKDE